MRIPRLVIILHALAWVFATTASVLVVVLASRYSTLSREYRQLRRQSMSVHRGLTLPAFEAAAYGAIGTSARVVVGEAPPDGRQLLFFTRANCPYCRATIPVWKQLAASLDSANRVGAGRESRFSVVAIAIEESGDSSAAVLREYGLNVPVVTFPTARVRRMYRASLWPQTIVVGPDGRVVYAKVGVFRNSSEIDTARALAIAVAPTPGTTVVARTSHR